MPIIVDLSQTIISNVIVHFRDDLSKGNPDIKNLIKHSLLTTLLSLKKQFGKEYGNLVLACDSDHYWRKDYFPAYKGHRKHNREDSPVDWEFVYDTIKEVKDDIRSHFKFKIIEVYGSEADDVIACITQYHQEAELVRKGLIEQPQSVLIASSDTDFVQLQRFDNVKQWSSIQKKWVTPNQRVDDYIIEHICTGDSGDNIPNILTGDQWSIDRSKGVKATRQKSMRKDRIEKFKLNLIDECANDDEKAAFERNRTLIDFRCIPTEIYDSIVKEYTEQVPAGNINKMLSYFTLNKMNLLLGELGSF